MTNTEFTANKLTAIDWAATDQRLTNLDFRLLWLMASAADGKTGLARRKQADLAEALHITTRAVQISRDHLVRFDYLEPIGKRPGGNVSGYKVVIPERRTPVRHSEKGEPTFASHKGKGEPVFQEGESTFAQRRTAIRTNLSLLSPFTLPLAPTRETENRGVSPRPDGARPAPLGKLEGELRQRLGGRFDLLSLARLLPTTDTDTVRLSVLTPSQRDQIKQKCEADILAAAGASQIEYVVAITGGVFAGALP
jgi:hypothetical protein